MNRYPLTGPVYERSAAQYAACSIKRASGGIILLPLLTLALAILVYALLPTSTALADQKPCGKPGAPSCGNTPPLTTPFLYQGAFYSNPIAGLYWDITAPASAWIYGETTYGSFCSGTLGAIVNDHNGVNWGAQPTYADGVTVTDTWTVHANLVGYTDSDCLQGFSAQPFPVEGLRAFTCPYNWSLFYQSTPPTVGPYCVLPNPAPMPDKAGICRGETARGDPCDVSNGNQMQVENDYVGTGHNDLRFTRTYNSLNAYLENYYASHLTGATAVAKLKDDEPIGIGWAATYFQTLTFSSSSDATTTYSAIEAHRPDGRTLRFLLYVGQWVPDGDIGDTLTVTADGYTYHTEDDTIETYDSNGQLVSVAARGSSPVLIAHASPDPTQPLGPPSFLPLFAIDVYGHKLAFNYEQDSNGYYYLISIGDPAGGTISFAHTTVSNAPPASSPVSYEVLSSVTYPDGTSRTYGYGANQSVLAATMTSLTDESSTVYATWSYDAAGDEVTAETLAGGVGSYQFSYQISGGQNSRTTIDPLGTTRSLSMQLVQGLSRTTGVSSTCAGCGDDAGRVVDANANITSRTDFNGNQTTYVYDTDRNLETSRTEAYGTPRARTITTQWDPNWRQPDLITEPNRKTGFTYDSMGNVLTKTVTDASVTPNVARTWTYTYDSFGRVLTADGPRTDVSDVTSYAYYTCITGSQCGQLQTVTDAAGNVTTYNTYDAYGEPLTITDPNGVVTTLAYDQRQRLISRTTLGEVTSFSYWPTGLLKRVTQPDNSYVQYTYDGAHRLTQIADGLGNTISYTLDAMGNRTAENSYDPNNVLHHTHSRVFNSLNELSQEVNAAGTAAVTTTFGYDSNANQTSIAAPMARKTGDSYDELNRLTQITDPASGVTQFGYDANDNLTSVTDPISLTTSYAYNGFGDLASQVSPATGTTTNTYDAAGNLATSTDARGAVSTYSYDALNRVNSVAYSLGGTTDQTIAFTYDAGPNGKGHLTGASDANHSTSWGYDPLGRVTSKSQTVGGVALTVGYGYTNADLTSVTTPSGQSIAYGYNANHQVTSVAVNGTVILSGATYEPFGAINGWAWGNGTTTVRTFDADGNISLVNTGGEASSYTFDNASRITSITNATNSNLSWTYGYDTLDRLNAATSVPLQQTFTFDGDGNRVSQGGSYTDTFTGTLSYDDAGRLTAMQQTGSSQPLTFIYNALGQRVHKTSPTLGNTTFVYDEAGHLLGEYDDAGHLIEEMVWLGDTPVATLHPNGGGGVVAYYVDTDHLNTPRKISRPSDNALVWRWDPDAFGNGAANQSPGGLGTFASNLRFPGQYFDAETGLNYNMARDYDPAIGRYVESDPIGLAGGGASTYAYSGENPISNLDPTGLFTSDEHAKMTYEAIEGSNDKQLQSCLQEAIRGAIELDYLPGSQTIPFAYLHAMAMPGESPAAAAKKANDFAYGQVRTCSCRALGYALHTMQDSVAAGHRGYQTYNGSVGLWHILNDWWPSRDEYNEAIMISRSVLSQFKAACPSCGGAAH